MTVTEREKLERVIAAVCAGLPPSQAVLMRRVVEVSARYCQRCAAGHIPRWDGEDWAHGCDQIDGADVHPESCAAAPLWEFLEVTR
jgi:hypothetical protein